jgi:MoxR-like ATPase
MTTLTDTEATWRKWLYFPDPYGLHVMLAAVAANLRGGDPVWVVVVGPPGCGKTELIGSISKLPNVYPVSIY